MKGGKIVGERITKGSETKYYRYLYAGEKVIGLTSESGRYYFQYGTSGNIVRVCKEDGSIAARYEYDAWGKCRFFKQKTAYVIGTGDWSSDVCSSDLDWPL